MTEQTNDEMQQETAENEAEKTVEQPADSSVADDSEGAREVDQLAQLEAEIEKYKERSSIS